MRLGYVILYVPDVEAALDFHERAFGLARRFVHDSGAYAELDTGATVLAFASEELAASHGFDYRPNRPQDSPSGMEIALVTDDVAVAYDRALAAGAAAVRAPETKPWGQIVAYVRDINGCLVELCTPVGG